MHILFLILPFIEYFQFYFLLERISKLFILDEPF